MTTFIEASIEGISPLLMNRFGDEAAAQVTSSTAVTFKGDKGTPRDQAERRLYKDERGVIHVPGPNIFRAIIDAGIFHKAGKSKVTTMRTSLVPAGVQLSELTCPVFHPRGGDLKWEVDARSVVIPSTGWRVMSYRPRLDEWSISFTLEVDASMFGLALVRALLDDAGKKIGLCDFRPARKGPFGRFVVTKWTVDSERNQ